MEKSDERYSPGSLDLCTGYEHIHRYLFATPYIKGKKVLDLACGEGYGSAWLAQFASEVVGIDRCPQVISHARKRYSSANLSFQIGSIEKIPLEDPFDAVICFEAIEHVENHESVLKEVKRLLKPNGLFILSTPNKRVYSENGKTENPFHVKELDIDELNGLLHTYFQHTQILGQKTVISSRIFPLQQGTKMAREERIEMGIDTFHLTDQQDPLPRYFLALASNQNWDLPESTSYLTDVTRRKGFAQWVVPEKKKSRFGRKKKMALLTLFLLGILILGICKTEGKDEALTIFVHIPKTAGEAFKRNIEDSYPKYQFVRTSFTYNEPYYDLLQKAMQCYGGVDHFKAHIAAIPPFLRQQIRCIGGHDSYWGIHDLFERKPKYITFIREPIARTISLYNFERMAWKIYSEKDSLSSFETTFLNRLKNHFLIDGNVPDFETWLDTTYDQGHPFYFSMSKYLAHLGFSSNSLDSFDFVGLTESYDEDSLFLYHELGVNRFYADKNASIPFITIGQLEDRVIEKIKEKNREDFELYQRAIEKNRALKSQRTDFKKIVSFMQVKKRLFLGIEPALQLMDKFSQKWERIYQKIKK